MTRFFIPISSVLLFLIVFLLNHKKNSIWYSLPLLFLIISFFFEFLWIILGGLHYYNGLLQRHQFSICGKKVRIVVCFPHFKEASPESFLSIMLPRYNPVSVLWLKRGADRMAASKSIGSLRSIQLSLNYSKKIIIEN